MSRIVLKLLPAALIFTPLMGGAQIVWEDALVEVGNFPENPAQEDIYRLATYAGNEAGLPESIELKEKAFAKLKTLPDFPECVVRELREAEEMRKAAPDVFNAIQKSRSQATHNCIQTTEERLLSEKLEAGDKALAALARLPDPRVVRLLGDLLSESGVTIEGNDGTPAVPPNAVMAARALGRMIENPPLEKYWENYLAADVEPWAQWYERAKKEKRSFRFKGSTQDYNLDGPVPVTLAGERRPSKRDLAPLAADTSPEIAEKAASTKTPRIALFLVAFATLGYGWMSRRGRTKPAS